MIDYEALTDMEVVAIYNAFFQLRLDKLYTSNSDEFKNVVHVISSRIANEYSARIDKWIKERNERANTEEPAGDAAGIE